MPVSYTHLDVYKRQVYVNPEVDKRLGISLGMKREQVEKAEKEANMFRNQLNKDVYKRQDHGRPHRCYA